MRAKDDLTYVEYKEGVTAAFDLWKHFDWTVEQVLNYMLDEDEDLFVDSSKMLWLLSFAEYEVRNDIELQEKVLLNVAYHIYRYENNMGNYKKDFTLEEKEEIEKDIAYIKSKIELPELNRYE